ncbi:MAG: nucleoside-triphosphatase [Spirochaetes bacterium]|jgi:nucleoside-triphosphatase|nr:nucleoside-triphosphatase [Spirochaetota bacterium]
MNKNIFITGAPSTGKTTVIKKVIAGLAVPCKGFYTEEERAEGGRTGFIMRSIDGRSGYLARRDAESAFRIRRYGVIMENIDSIAVSSISPDKGFVIILYEIGRMECFSENFRQAALSALDSECIVVGTIALGGPDFIREVKARRDMDVIEVTLDNRDSLPGVILERIRELAESNPC